MVLGLLLATLIEDRPLPVGVNVLRWAEGGRTSLSVNLAKTLNLLATPLAVLALRLVAIGILAVFKRFRHLVVCLLAWVSMDLLFIWLRVELPDPATLVPPISTLAIPRVDGVPTYFFPGSAMVAVAVTLISIAYALAPAGTGRSRARLGAVVLLCAVAASRVLLAAAYPSSAFYPILLGAAVCFVAFKWLAPDESFPVSYRRGGNAAHLDLGGARAEAVERAMADQIGLAVTGVKAFGDEGSGGSTPMLMTSDDGVQVFGKILATSHARSDRWYRIGRTIIYGQLEDEVPFGSVRRLIGYEDYALRLLHDLGFRVAHSYGVVELTPNREYLLPTEFFAGSQTLGHAEVNDTIVDEGMALIRKLWDEGLAHRDVKPANLLVVDGHLQLIDVSGLEVRPSPWRQAVDLANMMLVMALRSDAQRVYEISQRYFTPEEVGEAFACAVGMAIPTELQRYLKEDGRHLVATFKGLAPPYPAVSIQRWSVRRIALTLTALAGGVFVIVGGIVALAYGLP